MGSFDIFFDLRLNKRFSKQSRRRWFETPSHSWCRHCNAFITKHRWLWDSPPPPPPEMASRCAESVSMSWSHYVVLFPAGVGWIRPLSMLQHTRIWPEPGQCCHHRPAFGPIEAYLQSCRFINSIYISHICIFICLNILTKSHTEILSQTDFLCSKAIVLSQYSPKYLIYHVNQIQGPL